MKRASDKQKVDSSLPEGILDRFPGNGQKEIEHIWNRSCRIPQKKLELTDDEVEKSLRTVHQYLGFQYGEAKGGRRVMHRKSLWLSAAAVLLFIAGIGWILTPKSHSVPYGETAVVTLPDGSAVEMNSGTSIWYSRLFFIRNRKVQLNGEAFFDVESSESPFVVHANGASITVTGTRFNIRSWNSDPDSVTTVTVSEGEVLFSQVEAPDQSVRLTVGESSSWSKQMDKPSMPLIVSMEGFPLWRYNIIQFDNQPVSLIFRELERRFDVQIILETPVFGSETLSAYYANPDSIESVLGDICTVKGCRYSESTKGYRVYRQ